MTVHAKVSSGEKPRPNQVETRVAVTIRQLERVVAELEYEIPLTRMTLLEKLEQRSATRSIALAKAHDGPVQGPDALHDLQAASRS